MNRQLLAYLKMLGPLWGNNIEKRLDAISVGHRKMDTEPQAAGKTVLAGSQRVEVVRKHALAR